MHKNKSAESASTSPPGDNHTERPSDSNGTSSSSSFTMLQAAPELTRERDIPELLRDPFADDEEEGEGSGSGSDDEGTPQRGSVSGWQRGGWWRGVVRSARGRSGRGENRGATERFGDGRDDSDSDAEAEAEVGDGDDEEFGDFAMPEAVAQSADGQGGEGKGEGEGEAAERDRETDIVKPLPLHPAAGKSSASPFGSLWPFSSQGFRSGSKERERRADEGAKGKEEGKGSGVAEEPLERRAEVDEGVLDEDGKKVERAVQAQRRTSIEDPDEDEKEDVGVGRRG